MYPEKFKTMWQSSLQRLKALVPASKVLIIALAGLFVLGTTSCSSQKKLARKHAKEARLAQIAQAKADLYEIINDDGFLTIETKEKKLQNVKDLNLQDTEVDELIVRAEEKLTRDRAAWLKQQEEEARRREAERLEQERREKERQTQQKPIQQALIDIATAPNLRTANERITETLKMFESNNVPVLILIHEEGDTKDYDRPTTIQRFLELIKDQKRYNNDVENVRYDAAGKIIELELRTRY